MTDINLWFGCKNVNEIQTVCLKVVGVEVTLNTRDDWQLVYVSNNFEIGYDPEEGLRVRPYEGFDAVDFLRRLKRIEGVEKVEDAGLKGLRITLKKGVL